MKLKMRFAAGVWLVWVVVTVAIMAVSQLWHHNVWPPDELFKRWDGGWYWSIIQYGYRPGQPYEQSNVAFFPLYPLLVRGLRDLTQWPAYAAGVVVSVSSFLAALVVLYDLVRRRFDETVAKWTTVLVAFNPFAMFFTFVYTESLFLLLAVLTFWLMERRLWWWAAIAAGLASATRSVGAALGVVLVLCWLYEHRSWLTWRRWWLYGLAAVGLGLVSVSGLLAYMWYLGWHNQDPLAFLHAMRFWGRSGIHNLWPELQNAVRETRAHHFPPSLLFAYLVWYVSLLAGVAGLGLILWQRLWGYALFVALGLTLPILSGTVGSINRYAMVLFPIYIALARALQGRERWLAAAASGLSFVMFWLFFLDPRKLFFG